jgi:hypothetical protein
MIRMCESEVADMEMPICSATQPFELRLLMKEVGKMRGATNMLSIKAQLLIAAILVSATGVMAAETADQTTTPAAAATDVSVPKAAEAVKKPDARKPADQAVAAAEIAVPKADAAKKADARKQMAEQSPPPAEPDAADLALAKTDAGKKSDARKPAPHTASSWRCGWAVLSWFNSCSSGRVGLVLGVAY